MDLTVYARQGDSKVWDRDLKRLLVIEGVSCVGFEIEITQGNNSWRSHNCKTEHIREISMLDDPQCLERSLHSGNDK